MEYIIFALMIFVFIVFVMIKGLYDDKKSHKKFVVWLRNNYGVLPNREEYKPEEIVKISKYFEAHKTEGFYIDDITWNDLNMDAVFKQMNYTYSAAGEEYLYYVLHKPLQNKEDTNTLEKHINFFMENEEERIKYQTYFAQLGKTGRFSIYDYLNYLDLLGERSNKVHYFGILTIIASILIMFFSVQIGIVLLIVSLSRNIISYFKIKNDIDPYITSFNYIIRLLNNVRKLESMPIEVLIPEMEELKKCRKNMDKFKSGSYIIMSSSRMNASSNPLEIILDYFRMMFHLDLIKFNNMLSEVYKNKEAIDKMLTIVGYIETTIAIGAYRVSREVYCIPELSEMDELEIINMYHPLIEDPVKNSISTQRGVMLTGSNASGKSTFLKTVAINAILAQTINTCLADRYQGGWYRIMSSMSLRDDLAGGDSYYIVEIKSLKRILDYGSREGNTILCFVDEVLRGTNTVERIAASTQILKSLAHANALCFAATHDIELTHLLQDYYNNYHFEEEIIENDIVFNYKLLKGRATTRNAIKLLSIMGYDENIIHEAEELAENFIENGTWADYRFK